MGFDGSISTLVTHGAWRGEMSSFKMQLNATNNSCLIATLCKGDRVSAESPPHVGDPPYLEEQDRLMRP